MSELTKEQIVEVVGDAIAEKAEAITAPLVERLDAFETQLGEVAAKAESATKSDPGEESDEAAAKQIADAVEAAVAPLKEELSATKTAHEELLTGLSEKLEELEIAPKSIQDDPDGKGDEKKADLYERDALGRRIRKETK